MEQYGRMLCYRDIARYVESGANNPIDFARIDNLSRAVKELDVEEALACFDGVAFEIARVPDHDFQLHETALALLKSAIVLALFDLDVPDDIGRARKDEQIERVRTAGDPSDLRDALANSLQVFDRLENDKGTDRTNYQRIKAFIDENYTDQNLSSALVGKTFAMSPSNITRLFNKYNHTGFLEYVHEVRVATTCRLLEEGDLTVSDIATAVGSGNPLTLTRAFKARLGTTPGNWRKQHQHP